MFRLIMDQGHNASYNMSMDEAILQNRKNVDYDTLRIYWWKPSAVSIGYFQSIFDEVDMKYAKKEKVEVVRRITGGGAVFHDERGEITYSIILSEKYPLPDKILDSYKILCDGVVKSLEMLGLSAEFAGINDVIVNGKKISGNAQTRRYNGILQHGTILYDVNPEKMFTLLKVPNEKIKDKLIKNIFERVTSLKREGIELSREETAEYLAKGYISSLNMDYFKGEPTEEEKNTASKLKVEKYSSDEWNLKR